MLSSVEYKLTLTTQRETDHFEQFVLQVVVDALELLVTLEQPATKTMPQFQHKFQHCTVQNPSTMLKLGPL